MESLNTLKLFTIKYIILLFINSSTALAITGTIRSISREKVYQKLELESLQLRRSYRKPYFSIKFLQITLPIKQFFSTLPTSSSSYRTRNSHNIPQIRANHNFLKNFFFPSMMKEWNHLDYDIHNFDSFSISKSESLNSFDLVKIVYLIVII